MRRGKVHVIMMFENEGMRGQQVFKITVGRIVLYFGMHMVENQGKNQTLKWV